MKILQKMAEDFKVITSDFVNLVITSSAEKYACTLERRFPKSLSISELKGKMELQTGGNAATMHLELYDEENQLIAKLSDSNRCLGSYPVENGMRIHVIDNFMLKNELEDLSKVEKFNISEEEYSKRPDTVKAFLKKNKLGKYNAAEMEVREAAKRNEEEAQEAAASQLRVGSRCEVRVPSQPARRGVVAFVGAVHFAAGAWAGIRYDEPLGKNNGTVDGKFYFECPEKYGGFVRPTTVVMGDFAEEAMDTDDEI